MQNLVLALFGGVGEAHILKLNGSGEALQSTAARRPLLHVVLRVEEAEDRSRSAHRLLEAVVEVGELAHRIVELEEQDDESAEEAHGHAAVQDFVAPDEQKHGNGDGADGIHQRRTDGLNAHAAQVGAKRRRAAAFLKRRISHKLGVEGLDDAVAGDGFMQDVLDLGKLVLSGAGAGAHFAADLARGSDHHGNKQQQRPAEVSAESDDQHQPDNEGKELLQELAEHRADRGLHLVHIVDERGKNGARGVLMKEAGGAAQRGFVEMIAQIGNRAEAGIVDQVGAQSNRKGL